MNKEHELRGCDGKQRGAGRHRPTSFWMHDPAWVFDELKLREGDTFADLGCGVGEYTLQAANIVEPSGIVYALDQQPALIEELRMKIQIRGWTHVRAQVADVTASLPIVDASVDVCLLATVLHIPEVLALRTTLFAEVARILKPGGRLAIIECKKQAMWFGPPLEMRVSAEEVEQIVRPWDFEKLSLVDLGSNYLIHFRTPPRQDAI